MNLIIIAVTFFVLFLVEIFYFKLAEIFNIIDHPNHRSSHTQLTLRGGGIIFSVSLLLHSLWFGLEYPFFILGLMFISFVSFMDDINPVSSKVRISIHLMSVSLLFYQLNLFDLSIYWIILALVLVIGSINAINFMDGINGITGAYALITLLSLWYIDNFVIIFINPTLVVTAIISVLVFDFFNFRQKAKCFAGDVGSVGIAFIILFFLLKLIIATENLTYLLLLLIYGLDTVTTIIFRLIRKEKIVDAHRSHFYQYLANERKIPHLVIASIYSLIQLIINSCLIVLVPNSIFTLLLLLVSSVIIFTVIRFSTEGSSKLLDH